MKRRFKTIVITMGLLVLTGNFIGCKKGKTASEILQNKKNKSALNNLVSDKETTRKPVVFVTGYDKNEASFYTTAISYFANKEYQIVEGAYSIEEIIEWLNSNASEYPYGEIHIVNNNIPQLGLDLETTVNGQKLNKQALKETIENGEIPALKNVLNETSKIIFHGNGISKMTGLISNLKRTFETNKTPQVLASPYFTVFGGEFTDHYLAKPHYVFYPTANSPGKVDLSKEIARKYPNEKEIEWFSALTNERERYVGEPYTVKYNVPIEFTFNYVNSDEEMPYFTMQEEIMDLIANDEDLSKKVKELNIPIEKFRWKWQLKDDQLTIKGLSTVLCVLKPIIKPYGDLEHVKPDTSNKRLYAMK
ncbi:hypothetical protein SAMN04489761_0135 [Tenacibaculum sp. MAR_2009_124]|uniref:hypothetical protein n=1 Tax=Tenacibaculum sp. MAR_2009_124 TaxID=1250059 RepID=UPI00089BCCBA|nr:hypothetical protein [Tenacibaculum sp. MAR_2009_124]SEB36222.1 hypothetical protein SAMN04489761_0135 [Tenacibaculum sp. MAR_2009_124]